MKNLRYLLLLFLPVMLLTCKNSYSYNAPETWPFFISVSSSIKNGKITILENVKSATSGTQITLSVEPAVFYDLASLYYTANGTNHDIYPKYDEAKRTCIFSMPTGDTVVYGTFERYIRRIGVSVNIPEGGAVKSSPANTATPEQEVTVDVAINSGYRLIRDREKGFDSFFSLSNEGQINWLNPNRDSFLMPDSNVTLRALFERAYGKGHCR